MSPKSRPWRIGVEVLLWAVCLRLVMVFARAGWDKFDPTSSWTKAFTYWGYPFWFQILIGVLEIGAALLLLWPRAAAYGAAIIIFVMLGGMGTHVFVENRPSRMTSELVHLVFASIVLAGRWQVRIKRLTR
jgi:putative oxidoreductase